jgi:D-alanyl-D-alanine carboxypeptidase (penicillin-binding protein 4)
MKTIILTTIQILFIIFPIISFSQQKNNSAQIYIDTKLKTDTLFTNSITAIYAIDKNGKTIAEWNSNYNLIPASTLKTITTGIALSYLGTDYKYETKIGITGKIKDSTLIGDLYIIGGGDPTLGSKDTIATPIDTVFTMWRDAICRLGIKSISGSIIVDDSWFVREQMPDSWTWDDFGTYYGCAASGLSFCENIQYHTLIPGANVGDTASIVNIYPVIPDFTIDNEVITSKIGSTNTSYYYTQDLAPIGKYIGNIPINAKYKTVENSNKFPHLSCGHHFKEFLNNNGVSVCNKIIDYETLNFKDSLEKPRIIITTYSPELIRIVEVTNKKVIIFMRRHC